MAQLNLELAKSSTFGHIDSSSTRWRKVDLCLVPKRVGGGGTDPYVLTSRSYFSRHSIPLLYRNVSVYLLPLYCTVYCACLLARPVLPSYNHQRTFSLLSLAPQMARRHSSDWFRIFRSKKSNTVIYLWIKMGLKNGRAHV